MDTEIKYKNYDPGTLEFVSERSRPPNRSWYGKEENIFHPWFLDKLDLQPTLLKKIKCWLELEYNFHFTPTTSRPKCPTPISSIWHFLMWNKYGPKYLINQYQQRENERKFYRDEKKRKKNL